MTAELTPAATTACCTPAAEPAMSADDAERTARLLKALADPARLRLLALLARQDGGEACVCDLVEPVGLSQPTVSHHLKVLADAGFVTREKRGVWVYYTLVPSTVRELGAHLSEHLLTKVAA